MLYLRIKQRRKSEVENLSQLEGAEQWPGKQSQSLFGRHLRMDRLLAWLSAHGGAVGLGVGVAVAGGAAYAVYRSRHGADSRPNDDNFTTGSVSSTPLAPSVPSATFAAAANLATDGGSSQTHGVVASSTASSLSPAPQQAIVGGARPVHALSQERGGASTGRLAAAVSSLPLPPAIASIADAAASALESAAQPVWAGLTSVASSLTPSQIALLLVLCLAIVSVYAAGLLLAVLPAATSSRAAPVGWALVGFAAATAHARSGGDAAAGLGAAGAGAPAVAVGGAGAPSRGGAAAHGGAGAPSAAQPAKAAAAAPLPLPSSRAASASSSAAAAPAATPASSAAAASAHAGAAAMPAAADSDGQAASAAPADSSVVDGAAPAAAVAEGAAASATSAADVEAAAPEASVAETVPPVAAPSSASTAADASAGSASSRLFARLALYVGAIDALDTQADAGTGSDVDTAHALGSRSLAAAQAYSSGASEAGAASALAALPELPAGTRTAPAHESEAAAARYARIYPPLPPSGAAYVAALRWRLARNRLLKGGAVASGKATVAGGAGAGAGAKPGPDAVAASKPIFQEGLDHALATIAAQETCADGHKFASILYAKAARDTKEQISFAYRIRDHGRRCLELRPDDSVAGLVLGTWCYEVAGLGWLMRQAAAALYGTPPTSSYEEALRYLHQSEDAAAAPGGVGVMMSCRLKIAQSYWQLGRKDEAKRWTALALAVPVSPAEDPADVAALAALASKLGLKA